MQIHFFSVVYLLTLTSCATIIDRREIISLDSNPRGAAIFKTKEETTPMGWTPLWLVETKRSHQHYFMEYPKTERKEVDLNCGIDRWNALLGNGIIAIGSPFVGLGGLALDVLTEYGFSCKNKNYVIDLPAQVNSSRYCRTFIVAPPHHDDESISDQIAERWIKEFMKQDLAACDEVIEYEEGKKFFSYINQSYSTPIEERLVTGFHGRFIGSSTDASHVVILDEKFVLGDRFIAAKFVDLHRDKTDNTIAVPPLPIPKELVRLERDRGWGAKIARHLHLFPNAAVFSLSFVDAHQLNEHAYNEDMKIKSVRRDNELHNRSIPGFYLTHVEHPESFRQWDYDLDAFPSFTAKYGHWDFTIDPDARDKEDEDEHLRLLIAFTGIFYNGKITLHTPAGAFGLGVGFGGMIVKVHTNDGLDLTKPTTGYIFLMDYVAFINPDLYFTGGTQLTGFGERFESERFKLNTWSEAYMGIGFFFPDARTYVRRALK